MTERSEPICPLCDRPIPRDALQSVHHLTPKLKGGRNGPTVLLHEICHRTIHATFSETELAKEYMTVERLRAHPTIEKFIAWVARKDPSFHARNAGPRRGRRRRR
jgi:hypothetical protein